MVIQNRGQAEVVIIPFADYELLQEARERHRRQQAIAILKQIALEAGSRNEAMRLDDAQKIADDITAEAVKNLAQQGKVQFSA